ncbi:MAG: hypothetical protein QXT19_00820 [Candidatus Woesearchaeota archaeon]
MKGTAIILVVMLAAAGGLAWYYLQPAGISEVEMQSFVNACIQESSSFVRFVEATKSNDTTLCGQQTVVMMKLCMAHISKDTRVCDSVEPDIKQSCLALATDDRTQCPADDLLCKAVLGDLQACKKMNLKRFACEETLVGNTGYAGLRMEEDCKQLAVYTIALESEDKRNCRKISNEVLREECIAILKG